MKRPSISENHAKAPICAKFVEEMREVFGEVVVLYVRENGFLLDRMKEYAPQSKADQRAG